MNGDNWWQRQKTILRIVRKSQAFV